MIIPEWTPPANQTATLGHLSWNVGRLIDAAKDLDVYEVPIDFLCIPHTYRASTREMVMHIRAVNAADLSCPIILDEDGELLDGSHRIVKALLLGHDTILAVRFDTNPLPCKDTSE